MSASVKITGLKELQVLLDRTAKDLTKNADAIISSNVDIMVRNAKSDAPVDMGVLKGGITKKKNSNADYTMASNASYSPYIEFGTKGRYQPIPGIDASEFKGKGGKKGGKGFYDTILDWVKRKKIAGTYSSGIKKKKGGGFEVGGSKGRRVGSAIDRQIEDEQTAWAIYLSIIRHGVKAHPFFFKQKEEREPAIIRQIEQSIVKFYG
jgi:hypothetical protein